MTRHTPLLLAALAMTVAVPAHAQKPPLNLAEASLEDLMNIEITSASRKEQRAEEVPAAIYVITHDDIRRSGMTSVPDLLRLAPGVHVAQINSNKWAISVRGFNGLYSNKLLVLVDGRSVYNPLFSGVLWDTEDLMLEDVDRIEVIRGPGAAVWGANAVNGVINIIGLRASDTSGLLVRAGAGTNRSSLAVRYGGTAGDAGAYRVFAQLSMMGNSVIVPPAVADDHWRSLTSGFRGDWAKGAEAYMLEGGVSVLRERPLWVSLDPAVRPDERTSELSDIEVGHALSRWTHARSNGATLQVQSFVDVAHRQASVGEYRRYTVDLDAVYHTARGWRHDLVVGGGYRYINEAMDGGVGYSFNPNRARATQVNAFAQDEISLLERRVGLTLGAKIEHESDDGSNLQPTARVMWNVTPRQHVWAAVSRALRTPSFADKAIRISFPAAIQATTPNAPPVALTVRGNPASQDERLVSTETGYRHDIGSMASIDVVGFIGRYQRLQTSEPGAPTLISVGGRPIVSVTTMFQNLLAADTKGAEISARLRLGTAWQVDGTFSAFHLTPHPDAASRDPNARIADGDAPAYQWRGHSAVSLGPRARADVLLFYVGSLGRLQIPDHTRADARFELKLTPRLSATAQGQNLLSRAHPEFGVKTPTIVPTEVPRSAGLSLTWRF